MTMINDHIGKIQTGKQSATATKKMLDWRREQKRLTELGLENEFYDILDVHDLSLTKGNKIKIDIDKTDN
jgi:hypothetical protein